MLQLRAIDAGVDLLRAGRRELRLGLRHIGARDHARGIAIARQFERARVAGDRFIEQAQLRIGNAQEKIILGELGLSCQARRLQIGAARLCRSRAGLDTAPHAAPDIGLPVGGERQGRRAIDAGVGAGATARIGRVCADRRKICGARLLCERQRLVEACDCCAQILIRDFNPALERIQFGIVEHAPPGAACGGVVGLCRLPRAGLLVGRLLEGCRQRDLGPDVVGTDRAARECGADGDGNARARAARRARHRKGNSHWHER